jgi:hypothetical protein
MSDLYDKLMAMFGRPLPWPPEETRPRAEFPLDECSITSHCFVSNRHTLEPGCRAAPRG